MCRYKEGPLVVMPRDTKIIVDSQLIEKLESIGAKGVIYRLPADKTYEVNNKNVKEYILEIVGGFKNTSIDVILDLTPNFVTAQNELYTKALENDTYRRAFVWMERARTPNNWLSKEKDGTAWKFVKVNNYVLSQFGENNIDLQLNNPIAKDLFKQVLRDLVRMGVNGFRLANAKHYIIDENIPDDKSISQTTVVVHTDYNFWTHAGSTYQPGIGKLLHEFWQVVNNETKGKGFLSVTDYLEQTEVFKIENDAYGFDLPITVNLTSTFMNDGSNVAKRLKTLLSNLKKDVWLQWPYEKSVGLKIGTTEYNIFLFLLPGVPVGSLDDFTMSSNDTLKVIEKLEEIRTKPSYQHGSFAIYTDANDTVIAYSR